MIAKEKLLEIANEGNWEYHHSGELRCKHCGKWEWEGEHEEDCPLGFLLQLIEWSTK